MSELDGLIARLETCERADRDLNGDVWWHVDHRNSGIVFHNAAMGMPQPLDHAKPMPLGLGRAGVRVMAPAYTSSIDAVVALINERLPDRQRKIKVWSPDRADGEVGLFSARAKTAPCALLIAALRALEST